MSLTRLISCSHCSRQRCPSSEDYMRINVMVINKAGRAKAVGDGLLYCPLPVCSCLIYKPIPILFLHLLRKTNIGISVSWSQSQKWGESRATPKAAFDVPGSANLCFFRPASHLLSGPKTKRLAHTVHQLRLHSSSHHSLPPYPPATIIYLHSCCSFLASLAITRVSMSLVPSAAHVALQLSLCTQFLHCCCLLVAFWFWTRHSSHFFADTVCLPCLITQTLQLGLMFQILQPSAEKEMNHNCYMMSLN